MKLTKFFAVLLMFASLSMAVTSCNKDDNEDLTNEQIGNSDSGISALKDTGSELSYSMWETSAGVKVTVTTYYGYDKASGQITSMKIVYESSSSKYLDILYEELKNDNEGGKLTKSGNKITWVQSPDEYEDLTVDAVKFTYELLKGAHK